MKTKNLTVLSMLLAFSLIIFIIELQIPPIIPVPGVKLGLANIITLVTLVYFGRIEAFTILILRIILGNIFAGSMVSLIYSLSGGLLCFCVISAFKNIFSENKLWILSICGAIAHNIGQITAAVIITSTFEIIWYLPVLIISAVITGAFTGLSASAVIKRSSVFDKFKNSKG